MSRNDIKTQREKLCTLMNELEIEEDAILKRYLAVQQKLVDIPERYQKVFSSPQKEKEQTNLIKCQDKVVP